MAGFDNDNVYFAGIDTRGVKPVVNQMTTNGQLLIGATAAPHIRVGSLASADGSITITTGAGTIDLSGSSYVAIPSTTIDGTVSAFTDLITVSRDFYPIMAAITPTSIVNFNTQQPIFSMGFNNPTYDNIFSGDALSLSLTVGNVQRDSVDALGPFVPAGQDIKIGIVTPSDADVYDFKLFLIGFYA